MVIALITIILALIVASVVLYAARLVINAFPVPQPWANLLYALVLLLVLLVTLMQLGAFGPPLYRVR